MGKSDCKSAELSMVVIRADGRKEDLGVVAYYHKNPLRRLAFSVKQFFKKLFKKE
jgi:hypothetical protein